MKKNNKKYDWIFGVIFFAILFAAEAFWMCNEMFWGFYLT